MTQGNSKSNPKNSESTASNKVLDSNDDWIEKIWQWADEFELLESEIPRNKEALLAMTKLEVLEPEITGLGEQKTSDVYRLGYIPDEITYLKNLLEINISGVNSSHLPQNIGQLTNLTRLSIYHSNLIELPDSIGQLSNLTELLIDESKLEKLPDTIGQLNNLNRLFIGRCQLQYLPNSIGQLTNITILDLVHCELGELPDTIGQLTNLTKLFISYCPLKHLPDSIGKLTNLTQIDLIHCLLRYLPDSIGQLVNLNKLYINHCELIELPESIGQLHNLTELFISHANIRELPESIGELTKLTKLDLINCDLKRLPDSIGQLIKLAELNLIHCNLKEIPDNIHQLKNLTKLNFTDCGFRELPEVFLQLTNLEWINFNGNSLDNLSTPMLNALLKKAVKVVKTTAFKPANKRHLLHYVVKSLAELPTPVIERLNHYLRAPKPEAYPHTDAHMRLIFALNYKLKPAVKITQLIELRQKFATDMVAMQSPSVWRQANTDDKINHTISKNKVRTHRNINNINHKENDNAVRWQDKIIANADGGDMNIRCYQSENEYEQNADNVVVLFFHGGGFCIGDINTHHEFCHSVCAQTGWAIVSIDYRLAPEHPAPTAIRDCLKAYAWLVKHAHTVGASSSRIVLAGDSAGGCLAALVAQQVSNAVVMYSSDKQKYMNTLDDLTTDIFHQLQNLPCPLAQLLLYPVTDVGIDYPSWKLYGQGLLLDHNDIEVFLAAYLQHCSLKQPHALISPMYGDNTQMCPSYIVAAELDVLRDEALVYAKQLRDYGINVQAHTILGAPHGFINLMSVHQGMGRETHHLIDEFEIFVRQLIDTEKNTNPDINQVT